jgi:hypothetical protein
MKDTGRTGFMAAYMEAAENLVVVSDDRETDDHPIVYFYGIENISRVEVHFERESDFPSGFVIYQEGLPPVEGDLSPYNEDTETFSLELTCGVDFEIYHDLVLNKSLFDAYPDQEDMTDSQYRRVKNILTSLALWTSIAYQTVDTAPAVAGVRDASGAYLMLAGKSVAKAVSFVFAVVAVVAVAVVVIACPPAALAVSSAGTILVPIITPVQVVASYVAIGAAVGALALGAIAETLPDGDSPPDEAPPVVVEVTIATGDSGPAGGVLLSKVEGTDDWIEVAPQDIGEFRMRNDAAKKACEAYSVTADGTEIGGWYLPDRDTLQSIYANLYKEGKIDYCGPYLYWSSTPDTYQDFYTAIFFLDGLQAPTFSEFTARVLPVRLVSEEEIIAFKTAQHNG